MVLDLDGRAYRTVGLLLTRPAYLSNAYVSGQRMRYTPPLRLFIAISILLFVVITVENNIASLEEAMVSIQSGDTPVTESDAPDTGPSLDLDLDAEEVAEFDAFISKIRLPLFSAESNANLQAVMRNQARENYRNLRTDPTDTLMDLLEYITVFMLAMMPLLALIQFVVFFPARRFYIEHLVLVLHNNAFVVAVLLLQALLNAVAAMNIPLLSQVVGIAGDLTTLWIPIYLFLSLKFFFRWGWLLTSLLFVLVSLAYAVTTATGMLLFAIFLFLLF